MEKIFKNKTDRISAVREDGENPLKAKKCVSACACRTSKTRVE